MSFQPMSHAALLAHRAADAGELGSASPQDARVALVLSGGGARAAHQVGVLLLRPGSSTLGSPADLERPAA